MRKRSDSGLSVVFVLLIGLLLSSACSASGASSQSPTPVAGAQQVTLTVGNSMKFDPATITVHAGQPVQLTLRNTGLTEHDFTLTDGVAQPVKITVSGGQTASGTFTIDSPGTYTFECSMPGHAAAGMQGSLRAE
jgi:nitrite reductase (NO-forming)